MIDTGARAAIESSVETLVSEALSALAEAPVTEEARTELGALARFVAGRDH